MGRGRPKTIIEEEPPRKFERIYKSHSGETEVWKYNLDIQPNGPIEVNITYSKGFRPQSDIIEKNQSHLPKSKRKYLNPINGKMVSYQRAYNLGLIK